MISIQEGIHTTSVYFPPKAIRQELGFCHDGVTIVFRNNTLTVEVVFKQDGQYTEEQEHRLANLAKKLLENIGADE